MVDKLIENTIPILGVTNLKKSIEFFSKVLGFSLDWEDETICSVSRDGSMIMLSSRKGDDNQNSWVWIGLTNDELIQEISSSTTLDILQQPTNNPWGYEMKIKDLDNNIIWLATGPKEN